MQRWSGYCLTGDVREHAVGIGWGSGGNGKSVFTETQLDVCGDYGHKANVELLLVSKADRHMTERAALAGKRFVAAAEAGDGRRLNEPLVKECSGGDRMTARFCFKDEFTFPATFKLFLSTNYRPEVRGTDEGIWRRLKLIPFTQRFWKPGEGEGPDHLKADPHLRAKLKAELPGILTWMVNGAVDWHRHGLGACKTIVEATADYRQNENTVAQFVEEMCVRDATAEERAKDLFDTYVKWAEDRKEYVMSQTRFGTGLAALGFGKRKSDGKIVIIGIRLSRSF
jgi:putative DNA primase/helicase